MQQLLQIWCPACGRAPTQHRPSTFTFYPAASSCACGEVDATAELKLAEDWIEQDFLAAFNSGLGFSCMIRDDSQLLFVSSFSIFHKPPRDWAGGSALTILS